MTITITITKTITITITITITGAGLSPATKEKLPTFALTPMTKLQLG